MNISQSSIQALQQQRLLLQLEYETEKEAYRRQTETVGIGRKVKRGDAWWPLRVGKSYYNSLNQLAVEVFRTTDTDIEHNFEFGRPVAFFTIVSTAASAAAAQPVIRYFRFTGTVSYVDGDRMLITVADNAPLIDLQGAENVGIISPYRAQVQYLRRLLMGREFFKPFRRHISVNTVDGFQGQERDVIVISLVRSNAEGQIGFLRDLRRMNVAITRTRMKVIILGDRHTLTRHPFYRQLWQYIQALHSGG